MGLKAEQLLHFAKIIEDSTGIVYSQANLYQLEGRIENVAKTLGMATAEDLWSRSQAGMDTTFKQVLLEIATNNETSFFRDKRVFDAIESHCFVEMKKNRPTTFPYQIWSAACSTGQEPYTLSMMISEKRERGEKMDVNIYATDISDRVLNICKAGVYSQLESQRGLPANLLLKYFTPGTGDTYSLNADVRARVRFAKMNLLDSWPVQVGPFDIIMCRNVLIYQNSENKKKIIEKLAGKLQPKGFLILGAAESMIGLSDKFDQISVGGAVFFQKKA